MKVGLSCPLWLERYPDPGSLQAVRAGSTEQETDLPGKSTGHVPVSSETPAPFRWLGLCEWGCLEVGMCWNHTEWLSICLSVYFLRRCFLLDNTLVNFLCKKSHHCCTLGRRLLWRICSYTGEFTKQVTDHCVFSLSYMQQQKGGSNTSFWWEKTLYCFLGCLEASGLTYFPQNRAPLHGCGCDSLRLCPPARTGTQKSQSSGPYSCPFSQRYWTSNLCPFSPVGKNTKQGKLSPMRVMSWEKRKRQRQRNEGPAQPKGVWCGIEEWRWGMR